MILKRLDASRFSTVLPTWVGDTVVIIGGGPSLTPADVVLVQAAHTRGDVHCIVVNDAYLLAPWADVHYAADSHWHKWHTDGIARAGYTAEQVAALWANFAGQKCSIQNSGGNITDHAVHMLRNKDFPNHGVGLSLDPQALVTGRNSGFQALNLAVLAGAKRILLLGFDGQVAKDGKQHWFGDHPRPTPPAVYPLYRQAMSAAEHALQAQGVEVINCSPGSAIDSFPKMALEAVL
jgi:hypothetical protein